MAFMPRPSDETSTTGSALLFLQAAGFEAGLGLLALALGYWIGVNPRHSIPSWYRGWEILQACGWGALLGLSMFAAAWTSEKMLARHLKRLEQQSRHLVRSLFLRLSNLEILALCLAAGVGEELLFRGLIQQTLATTPRLAGLGDLQWVASIGLASLFFALAHAISLEYFVATLLLGGVLGVVYAETENLLLVMVGHAIYDAVTLASMLRRERNAPESGSSDQGAAEEKKL